MGQIDSADENMAIVFHRCRWCRDGAGWDVVGQKGKAGGEA